MLAHTPHVEPGLFISGNVGVEFGKRLVPGDSTLPKVSLPLSGTVQAGIGLQSNNQVASAVRLAAGVSFPALAPLLDVYVEAAEPFMGHYDAGFGVGAQAGFMPLVLPYFEFGKRLANGRIWFVTNGVGMVRASHDNWHAIWTPTFAYGVERSSRRVYGFATAIIGGRGPDCWADLCRDYWSARRTYLMIGMGFE